MPTDMKILVSDAHDQVYSAEVTDLRFLIHSYSIIEIINFDNIRSEGHGSGSDDGVVRVNMSSLSREELIELTSGNNWKIILYYSDPPKESVRHTKKNKAILINQGEVKFGGSIDSWITLMRKRPEIESIQLDLTGPYDPKSASKMLINIKNYMISAGIKPSRIVLGGYRSSTRVNNITITVISVGGVQ